MNFPKVKFELTCLIPTILVTGEPSLVTHVTTGGGDPWLLQLAEPPTRATNHTLDEGSSIQDGGSPALVSPEKKTKKQLIFNLKLVYIGLLELI